MAWAIITINTSKCAQITPNSYLKRQNFIPDAKSVTWKKLWGWVPPPLVARRLTKAFDNISHEQLWVTMTEMGNPVHIIILLTKLYGKQQARVRVAGGLSNEF